MATTNRHFRMVGRRPFAVRHAMRAVESASFAACLLLSGCLILPHSEDIGPAVEIKQTDIGMLSRKEIVNRWGEPSAALENDHIIAYRRTHKGWMVCGQSGCRQIDRTDRLVMIQFDESNRVKRVEDLTWSYLPEPSLPPEPSLNLTMKVWEYRETIKRCITSRDYIIAHLGAPDLALESNSVYAYVGLPNSQMLLIEFDQTDRVARVEQHPIWSGKGYVRGFVSDWVKENAGCNG